jgi:uncharacterized protein
MAFDSSITRPSPKLMTYYTVFSVLTGPFFPLTFIPLFLRYRTMRFVFDEQGITQSYGHFFHTEKRLNYRRVQDIRVTSGVLQRRFGLAAVALFTASGSAGPEMVLEGFPDPAALRDYLYAKSRGARQPLPDTATAPYQAPADEEALELLREIRDALVAATALRPGGTP